MVKPSISDYSLWLIVRKSRITRSLAETQSHRWRRHNFDSSIILTIPSKTDVILTDIRGGVYELTFIVYSSLFKMDRLNVKKKKMEIDIFILM